MLSVNEFRYWHKNHHMLSIDEIRNWYRDHPGEQLDLKSAYLPYVDLRHADLRQADLRDADLGYTKLRQADLRDVDLGYTKLQGAKLQGAKLQGAKLWGANLRYVNLRGADLRGADLRFADLRHATLRGANLKDADLRNANLRHTDLRHVTGITVLDVSDLRGGMCYAKEHHGVLMIGAGCRLFTVEQALDHWGENYKGIRKIGDRYVAAITAFIIEGKSISSGHQSIYPVKKWLNTLNYAQRWIFWLLLPLWIIVYGLGFIITLCRQYPRSVLKFLRAKKVR